jgi:hypothetical protein
MASIKANHFEWAHLVFSYPVTTHSAGKTYRQAFKQLALLLGRGDKSAGADALMAAQLQELKFSFLMDRAGIDLAVIFVDCRGVMPEQSTIIKDWHRSDKCQECAAAYTYALEVLMGKHQLEKYDINNLRAIADANFELEWETH